MKEEFNALKIKLEQKTIIFSKIKPEQKTITFSKIEQESAFKLIKSDQTQTFDKIKKKEVKKFFNYVEKEQIKPLIDELLTTLLNNSDKINFKNENWRKLNKNFVNFHNEYTKLGLGVVKSFFENYEKLDFEFKNLLALVEQGRKDVLYIELIFTFINDTKTINKLIKKYKLDVNYKDEYDMSAILWAAIANNTKGLKLLIEKYKVDIYSQNSAGKNCAHFAIDDHWPAILDILAEKNFDFNKDTNEKPNPLIYALKRNSLDCFKLMMKHLQKVGNFDIYEKCKDGSLVQIALDNKAESIFEYLMGFLGVDTSEYKEYRNALAEEWHFEED